MAEKMTGRVKWFNDQKGYGFITPDDGGEDIFVHQSSIVSLGFRTLREDEQVEFTIDSSPGGRIKAVDVTGPHGNPIQGSRSSSSSGGRSGGRGGGRSGRGGGCYTCGEMGHMARDCPSGGGSGSGSGSGGGGGRYGGGCFNCGEPGHFARECPNTGR